jgi:hypothetical protein
MSRHDAPDAADLVSTVAELLHGEVLDAVPPDLRWQVRIAANVLDIVARELHEDPAVATAYEEGLAALGFADETALCRAIRDGDIAYDDPDLRRWVTAAVAAKLAVAKPGYAG